MTKNGVESENEFDVDEPEEVKKDELKPQTNSRRQSSRVRVSRVPVVVDTVSTDEDLSDDDFERLLPRKRMRGLPSGGGGRSVGGGRRGRPARVSSTTANGQPDIEGAGSEDNSNVVSGSDTEPTSTTTNSSTNYSPSSQSGSFVVSKKDFMKLTDPPIWKIDGKALLQKFIPFQNEGKTHYKNTSVYSGWSTSTKHKYYPCTIVFKKQTKRETVLEFLKDKIVPDENYVCSESEPEGDDDDERDDGEIANGIRKEKKNDSDDEDHEEDDDDEEEEEEEEGDHDDDEIGEKEENEEVKESDEKPKE